MEMACGTLQYGPFSLFHPYSLFTLHAYLMAMNGSIMTTQWNCVGVNV
jgi:hypothetical protein